MAHHIFRHALTFVAAAVFALPALAGPIQDGGAEGEGEEAKKEEPKKLSKEERKKLMNERKGVAKKAVLAAAKTRADEMSQALMGLVKIKHPMVVAFLGAQLRYQNLRQPGLMGLVRSTAADVLSKMVERSKKRPQLYPALAGEASKALRGAMGDRWNRKEEQGRAVMRKALEGLGQLGDKSAKKMLLKYLANPDPYLAEAAIRGLGFLRDTTTIQKIIQEWSKADSEGNKSSANDKIKERKGVIEGAAGEVLAALTGQQFDKPSDWRKWWSKAKGSFKMKPLEIEEEDEE